MLEVALAPRSESNVWEGLSGIEGVFVATHAAFVLGTPVRLLIQLPGGFEVRADSVADWRRDEGVGLGSAGIGFRFSSPLEVQDSVLLKAFSDYRCPMFFA